MRFTQEQIDLIDSQGQDSFTANLDHLLNEFLPSGESERGRRIRIELDRLRDTRKELDRLLKYLRACKPYVYALGNALENAIELENLLREDGADLPVPHPGRRL
ncbi:MAG: hypothetical protein NC305_12765 [Lachnospiraceae bacterium]|nr:hypothetical protein [Lachnospiraceae bacterium]